VGAENQLDELCTRNRPGSYHIAFVTPELASRYASTDADVKARVLMMALERVIFEHNSASARRLLVGRSSLGRATLLAHIRLEACCARARPACRDVCCCCYCFLKLKNIFVCFLIIDGVPAPCVLWLLGL
jgi:hypothetical protein